MRLIKLGLREFSSLLEVYQYFQSPTSELRHRGFLLPKGWISQANLQAGELILFSFRSTVRYVARAASGVEAYTGKDSLKYPYRVSLDLDSLRPAALPVRTLEKKLLDQVGLRKNIILGRGWPRLADDDRTVKIVEQLLSESLPPVHEDEIQEGLKEERMATFRKRNESIMKQRRENDGYACQVCGFFLVLDGQYVIDCHHLFPLHKGVRVTHLDDLACLCPTCHRIAHMRRPPFTIEEIRTRRGIR